MKYMLSFVVVCVLLSGCGKSSNQPEAKKPEAKKPEADAGKAEVPQITLIQSAPRILIEAEAAKSIEPPMRVDSDANASGGKFVQAPEGPDHKEISKGGSATYEIDVAEPGEYTLWIRKNWCCGCGNSLTLSVDQGKEIAFGGDATYGKWDWKRAVDPAQPGQPMVLTFAKGKHSLAVGNREDGSKFDQILFIQDNEYVPVSIEK